MVQIMRDARFVILVALCWGCSSNGNGGGFIETDGDGADDAATSGGDAAGGSDAFDDPTCPSRPSGCAMGTPGGICGDVISEMSCREGTWSCPEGTIPITQCACVGQRPPNGCAFVPGHDVPRNYNCNVIIPRECRNGWSCPPETIPFETCLCRSSGGCQPCGGIGGVQCPAEQYCDYGDQCRVPDGSGTCYWRPRSCSDIDVPVCGCDDRTYSNACQATMAGVTVLHRGACESRTGDLSAR
jgi:hypothetical protein